MNSTIKNLLLLLGLISFFGTSAFADDGHKEKKPTTEESDEDVEDSCD